MKRLRFALIGHPVGHSVSPVMCAEAFSALGMPHVYTALDVASEPGLRHVISELRNGLLAGVNVTVPHKQSVLDLVDERADTVEEVGAANVLVAKPNHDGAASGPKPRVGEADPRHRIVAHNTDVAALADELRDLWGGRPLHRAVVVGAGGAGLAAMAACKRLGFTVICATSRSWTSSEAMFDSASAERARALGVLTALWPSALPTGATTSKSSQVLRLQWRELAAQADCVIQATSAGMLGGPPGEEVAVVVPWERLPPHALVYDVVYNPQVTPFLQTARAHGFRAVGGLGMLVRQAQLAIEIWTGAVPPADVMRRAAEDALAARGGGHDKPGGGRR